MLNERDLAIREGLRPGDDQVEDEFAARCVEAPVSIYYCRHCSGRIDGMFILGDNLCASEDVTDKNWQELIELKEGLREDGWEIHE